MGQLNDLLVLGKTSLIGDVNLSSNFTIKGITVDGIINNTTAGGCGWSSNDQGKKLITLNTLAYWNGTYNGSTSNLKYINATTTTITTRMYPLWVDGTGTRQININEMFSVWRNSTNAYLTIGNSSNLGGITLHKGNGSYVDIKTAVSDTTNKTINLPDKSGTLAMQTTQNDFIHSGNEFTFASPAYSGSIWLNYRTASGSTNGNITEYIFGNGKGGSAGVAVTAETFNGKLNGNSTGHSRYLETFYQDKSAWYGTNYRVYAWWETPSICKLTVDGYSTKVDYATNADSANSVAWGNITGKPTSFNPASHNHTCLTGWADTRSVATTPNDYNGQFKVVGIKQKSLMDIDGSSYSSLIGFRGWGDSSGGNTHELAFTGNGNLYHRHGATTAWEAWNRIPMCGTANTFSGANTFTNLVTFSRSGADISGTSAGAPSIVIGSATGTHIALDDNEIMAKTSATNPGTLHLNNDGGLVQIGSGGLQVNGNVSATKFTGALAGNASTATKLATARTIRTNLASTSTASFNGSANITPGVTGTLAVGNGGTGQTTAVNACNAFLNALSTGASTPTDADYYISQYVGGGTTTTTYHRRPMSALWTYIRGKADSRYAKKEDMPMTEKLIATGELFTSDGSWATNSFPTADYDFIIIRGACEASSSGYGILQSFIKVIPTTKAVSYPMVMRDYDYANELGDMQIKYNTTKDKLQVYINEDKHGYWYYELYKYV